MQTCTLAVDIGASSGRHIVGAVQNGKITLQEVYRFENGVHRENGHLCWDIDTLAKEVVNGLKAAHDAGFAPATIGIDTWAVDFVLLDVDNKRIGDAVAYRDERTEGIREALEKEYGLTFADHYARTGIQYQPFNTVYQLMALIKEHPEQLAAAKTFLMVPDYLNYLLCGVPANEYTNASTTALVGADSRDWDDALIEKLGLPRGIFQPIKTAGTVLGHLTPDIQKAVGSQNGQETAFWGIVIQGTLKRRLSMSNFKNFQNFKKDSSITNKWGRVIPPPLPCSCRTPSPWLYQDQR